MRNHYNIILFDGSYILYRNQSVKGPVPATSLTGSFIQSIVKVVRDNNINFDVAFLAFDKAPYHRFNILNGRYKDDREKFTYQDINEAADKLSTLDESSNEYKELAKKKAHMEDSLNRLKLRNQSIGILSNFNIFGLTQLRYVGWEADDLARLITDTYKDKYSILLVSVDSDWIGMVDENVDFYRIRHRGNTEFYNIDNIKESYVYQDMLCNGMEDLGLLKYVQLVESVGVSHNAMRKVGEVPISEIFTHDDFDRELFERQLSTFDYKLFPDYIDVLNNIRNKDYSLHSLSEFDSKMIYELYVPTNSRYFNNFYKHIKNYSLLKS